MYITNIYLIYFLLENDNLNEEALDREYWDRKNKVQRKSKSYLAPNPYLRYLDISNSKNVKSLPILKNGSRFEELKSCNTKNATRRVVLTNTCAFDSISSIMMVTISL